MENYGHSIFIWLYLGKGELNAGESIEYLPGLIKQAN